jgi:hypothetical protein
MSRTPWYRWCHGTYGGTYVRTAVHVYHGLRSNSIYNGGASLVALAYHGVHVYVRTYVSTFQVVFEIMLYLYTCTYYTCTYHWYVHVRTVHVFHGTRVRTYVQYMCTYMCTTRITRTKYQLVYVYVVHANWYPGPGPGLKHTYVHIGVCCPAFAHSLNWLPCILPKHTWFSVHMCALFQSESCDITL